MFRLFQHVPTGRWLPLVQDDKRVTPGSAYLPGLATTYQLPIAELAVVVRPTLPPDLETNVVPLPATPPVARPLPVEVDPVFKATVLTLLDAINLERQTSGRPDITPQQFVTAVKAKLP